MSLFNRLSNGWMITMHSLKVLKANKQLIVFPILSGFSLLLVTATFFTAALSKTGWHISRMTHYDKVTQYSLVFLFYLINYFVVVFFNVGLMHCTRLYFKNKPVNLYDGLNYSISRIWSILSWALFAASVGTLLGIMQENMGRIGRLLISAIGIVWNVATFFVIPVIAYEKGNVLQAFKRSARMIKDTWGEKIGASFSFGLMQVLAILLVLALAAIMALIHPLAGLAVAGLGAAFVLAVISAARTIFISAVYHQVTGDSIIHHHQVKTDDLFIQK